MVPETLVSMLLHCERDLRSPRVHDIMNFVSLFEFDLIEVDDLFERCSGFLGFFSDEIEESWEDGIDIALTLFTDEGVAVDIEIEFDTLS